MVGIKSFMIATLLSMGTTEWLRKMENPDLFEGDIVLSPEQRRRLFSGNFPFGTVKGNYLWPRVIPYSISDELKGNQMAETAIKAAIADYEMFTCLRFVQRRSERNYMHFYKGTGCSSPVGNFGTRNPISLDSGCWHKGIVLHEMMHSLGKEVISNIEVKLYNTSVYLLNISMKNYINMQFLKFLKVLHFLLQSATR